MKTQSLSFHPQTDESQVKLHHGPQNISILLGSKTMLQHSPTEADGDLF